MKPKDYTPPKNWLCIRTVEMHTGGEPLRIIIDGLPPVKGKTILAKRAYFRDNMDYIRTGLMFEPRGHADMYGAVITEPTTPDGHFGTFFMHNEGYSTMCGHATLALTKYAIESGLISYKAGDFIRIDAPPGRLIAKARLNGNQVVEASFINVPSFVFLQDEVINVPGIGLVHFDIAYGGAFYAICRADELRLKLDSSHYRKLIDFGVKIKQAIRKKIDIIHPYENDLSFLYGVIFTARSRKKAIHSRNVCVFANGEVDRSATGSGVSARAALLHNEGKLKTGEKITIESILGTTMTVEIKDLQRFGTYDAVIPEVSGNAYFTGRNEFWFDPDDPLKNGFIFR